MTAMLLAVNLLQSHCFLDSEVDELHGSLSMTAYILLPVLRIFSGLYFTTILINYCATATAHDVEPHRTQPHEDVRRLHHNTVQSPPRCRSICSTANSQKRRQSGNVRHHALARQIHRQRCGVPVLRGWHPSRLGPTVRQTRHDRGIVGISRNSLRMESLTLGDPGEIPSIGMLRVNELFDMVQ
jgi:hypothetical protein